jgi:hypothetical protein
MAPPGPMKKNKTNSSVNVLIRVGFNYWSIDISETVNYNNGFPGEMEEIGKIIIPENDNAI